MPFNPITLIKKMKTVIKVGKNDKQCCKRYRKRSRKRSNRRYRAKKNLEMKLLLEKEKNSLLLEDKINSLNAEIINLKKEIQKLENNL